MKRKQILIIAATFLVGLGVGLATGIYLGGNHSTDSLTETGLVRGTLTGDLSQSDVEAVLADCRQYTYNAFVTSFSPTDQQKNDCNAILEQCYHTLCLMPSLVNNFRMGVLLVTMDWYRPVDHAFNNIKYLLTDEQRDLARTVAFENQIESYYRTKMAELKARLG